MMMNRSHGIAADELSGKVYDARLFKRMLRYLKPYTGLVVISFIALMFVSAVELLIPLITKTVVDDYIVSDKAVLRLDNATQIERFNSRYHYLKLPHYQNGEIGYYLVSNKNKNKIDKQDWKEFQQKGTLLPGTYFLADNTTANQQDLQRFAGAGTTAFYVLSNEQLAVPQTMMKKIPTKDILRLRGGAVKKIKFYSLLFLIAVVVRFLASFVQVYLTNYFSQYAMNDLRRELFAHLAKMPVQFFDKNPVGRLVTRVTNDVRSLDEMLSSGVITIIQDFIMIVAIIILMLLLNWQLALVSFSVLPFVLFVIWQYKLRTRVIFREVRKTIAALNSSLAEHISGAKIIQLFNQYTRKKEEFTNINKEYYRVSVAQLKLFAFFRPIIHVSSQVAVAVIIWYGGGMILRNLITIGMFMAFTSYISKLFDPINDFSEKFNILQGAMAGAERIFDLMDQPLEDYSSRGITGHKLGGEIEFKNLWLAYQGEEWVLKNVSFSVKPGEKIALVGHTGSGKTSIVNLILRMYPFQRGEILVDGKPIQSYSLEDIRSNVGMVQQDVFLFSGTIQDNIVLNNTDVSQEEMERVADYVNVSDFIETLPNKYQEPVMERGATFSVGQRQLISFARVLAYNPSIFILDEATSNIDTETEILIQDALEKIMHNRTSIVIAHRLSTIQHADRILVLHKGELVEQGTHQELLAKEGLYYDLYRLQYT